MPQLGEPWIFILGFEYQTCRETRVSCRIAIPSHPTSFLSKSLSKRSCDSKKITVALLFTAKWTLRYEKFRRTGVVRTSNLVSSSVIKRRHDPKEAASLCYPGNYQLRCRDIRSRAISLPSSILEFSSCHWMSGVHEIRRTPRRDVALATATKFPSLPRKRITADQAIIFL